MRRPVILSLVAGLLFAACSSGGDSSQRDGSTVPVTTGHPTTSSTTVTSSTGSTPPSPPGATDVAPIELPGLLDTSDDPIPNDASVRTGRLPNGLTYYVRENDNPGAKADLRLAVRAGSADELDPPTGVAHFVEHMLFNGTEQFPENDLIDVLRSFGASFGPDINAYTTYDETVYSLVVPNDDQTVELGLTVLDEWLTAATFDPDQVVAERGVVLDEWRVRTQTASGRLFGIASDMYLTGTPYAGRNPIGTAESIEAMDDVELRAYYDAWYRPDDTAIVVVGDIDVDAVEVDIQRIFGDAAQRSETPPDRADRSFSLFSEPDFRLHSDPDQQTVDVEVTLPLPAFESDGQASVRADLIDDMVFRILVQRLQRDVAEGTAPFDDVSPGTNSFVSGLDAPALYAFTDAERVDEALVALLDEYQRAADFGFTQAELETAVDNELTFFQTRYDGRDSTQDQVYADELVENFLRGAAYPSIDDEYRIVSTILDGITVEALEQRFAARWANAAPHVIISTPESLADQMPTTAQVLDMVEATGTRPVEARGELRDLPDEPMARPDPVEPLSILPLLDVGYAFFDPVELTYPNGVRVRLNPNEIVTGQVYLQATSPGGTSLVADDDVVDALYAADITTSSGVADFNEAELDQILTGTDVEVGAYLTPYDENFIGSAATSDIESMFQLLHLYMTEPRFDQVALRQTIAAEGPIVADPSTDPGAAENDALVDLRYDDEPRYTVLPSEAEFETLDLAGVERVWNERYGDAGDWVFVFSGDFDVDEVTDLASAYLGTLPGTSTIEVPVDVAPPPPTSVESTTITAGTGDTASLSLLFTSPIDAIDAATTAHADVVTSIVSARLTSVIREQLGDTYSPYVTTYADTDPDPVVETYVNVSGSPARIDELAGLVVDELADLAENGPSDAEFSNGLAEVQEKYNFVDNGQLLGALVDDALDPGRPISEFLAHFFALGDVTADSVQAFIATNIPTDAYVKVTVHPRG